jgi:hypothetical protein
MSLNAIGSGEGAQVYGWGIYSAANKEIAEWYRRKLSYRNKKTTAIIPASIYIEGKRYKPSRGNWIDPDGKVYKIHDQYDVDYNDFSFADTLLNLLAENDYIVDNGLINLVEDRLAEHEKYKEAIAKMKPTFDIESNPYGDRIEHIENRKWRTDRRIKLTQRALSAIKEGQIDVRHRKTKQKGQIYRLEVPESDVLLDWDKPFSEQPEKVIAALRKGEGDTLSLIPYTENPTGEVIYKAIAGDQGSHEAASQYLNSLGIPGLQYLDAGSRNGGEGTHNFVVWDEGAMEIMETYYQRGKDTAENETLMQDDEPGVTRGAFDPNS